jgi:SAM-dependent methyltransferase
MRKNSRGRFNTMSNVTLKDFARSFGTSVTGIRSCCAGLIKKGDFRYQLIAGPARDRLILSILKKIEQDKQKICAPERRSVWEKGWKENLRDFIKSNYDLSALTPRFIRPRQAVRFNQDYILPRDPDFELNYYGVFRQWLFKKYLPGFDSVYEFGCGTGFNLVALAQLFPEMKLCGLDFVPSAVKLVNTINKECGYNISARQFDMISPDAGFKLDQGSAVLTIGAIEQLAGKIEPFIGYLLRQPVRRCIHVEPAISLYDENNLVDHLAIMFQGKRGYTDNLLTHLRRLEKNKRISILKVKRLFFGSLMMEGYNYIIWEPR